MEATKNFASTTGSHPHSFNRICFILGFAAATMVIATFIDAHLFCGFNPNAFIGMPIGLCLLASCCMAPLLGLAVKRKATTVCARVLAFALVLTWQTGFMSAAWSASIMTRTPDYEIDVFNVCGNRTRSNVEALFSNAKPTFEVIHRIDNVFKSLLQVGWLMLLPLGCMAVFCFSYAALSKGTSSSKADKPTAAKHETISEISDQLTTIDIECESAPGDAAELEKPKSKGRKRRSGSAQRKQRSQRKMPKEGRK